MGTVPNSSCVAGLPRTVKVGLQSKGLGFTVPVLPPGTACLSAPASVFPVLLGGRLGAGPRSRAYGECAL